MLQGDNICQTASGSTENKAPEQPEQDEESSESDLEEIVALSQAKEQDEEHSSR
jgi:hypothetical protein